jgi:ArsR family metal-binding transcriptional regulator
MLVSQFEITHILPCIADPSKIRFHAEPSVNLEEVLPYLNAILPKAVYNHAGRALTFPMEHRIICVYPHLITGAKADDAEDARAVLDWLRQTINDTWVRREEITPSYERRERLTILAIYKLLPGAGTRAFVGCRRCGQPTCLAFALEVAAERENVLRCAPLFDHPCREKRQILLKLLSDAGYEVPGVYRSSEDS